MEQVVSITSQGQLTIPKNILRHFGINSATKAVVKMQKGVIMVEPKNDFWALAGSLKSDIKLSDSQLRKARDQFSQKWTNHE